MKHSTTSATLALLAGLAAAAVLSGNASAEPATRQLPYVYTHWQHFTEKDGLPNDHILACFDKRTGKIRSWKEKDGLPWRVVSSLDVNPKTGELWIGLFGGGLVRFSGGRFDHFNQLNSGLVNDVVYGVAVENDNVWAATTAGASRYNTITKKWTIYTEKNAPMEEIWNYGACYDRGKLYLAIWGSGVLEFDVATERWKHYLDPDGEMEIDLYRDDGLVHVITTATSAVDGILWISTYFGMCRYDGRHWRGYYAHETGLPSDFGNGVTGRSAQEAWFATDKGLAVIADASTDTWVTYTMDPKTRTGKAVVQRGEKELKVIRMKKSIPHNYVLWVEIDGNDAWVGTSKGLARAIGAGYYPGLKPR